MEECHVGCKNLPVISIGDEHECLHQCCSGFFFIYFFTFDGRASMAKSLSADCVFCEVFFCLHFIQVVYKLLLSIEL